MKEQLIYLAAPYAHVDPDIRHDRSRKINMVAGAIMKRGILVFSPISHGHAIISEAGNMQDDEYWMKLDLKFLRPCNLMIVLQLKGWDESTGVCQEIAEAKHLGIKVRFKSFEDLIKPHWRTL